MHIARLYSLALLSLMMIGVIGCNHAPHEKTMDDGRDLQLRVQSFHTDLRWARYESAAEVIVPEERARFLGRYEELGDDYKIANMDLVTVKRPNDKQAVVEMDQESYKEPQMTVKKQTFMELWEKRDGQWMLVKRLTDKEWDAWWKQRKKEKARETARADESQED
jgi:hypothetical protein